MLAALGGDKPKKEKKPLCQCPNNETTDAACLEEAVDGKLFCKKHMNCTPAPTNGFEPEYIANTLNKSKKYLETHNCLSYALRGNKINKDLIAQCTDKGCPGNFEQPGAESGERYAMRNENLRTCPVVEKLTKADLSGNFVDSSFHETCENGSSKVALVVDKGTDYHWYRQNPDGTWSHKDGSNPVKNFDANKRKIFNPKQASRDYGDELNYDNFCGFFCVSRTNPITLKQGGKRKKKQTGGTRKSPSKLEQNRRYIRALMKVTKELEAAKKQARVSSVLKKKIKALWEEMRMYQNKAPEFTYEELQNSSNAREVLVLDKGILDKSEKLWLEVMGKRNTRKN